MQTAYNSPFTVVNLDGIRVMGAPVRPKGQSKPDQYDRLRARVAQRASLDLPPIRA